MEEVLNVYDSQGRVIDYRPRSEAKASGLAVGAINVLAVTRGGLVLLQRRPSGTENGGLWDKSVGGHVSAGEEFDDTAVRETGEELFDDPSSPRVRLATGDEDFVALVAAGVAEHIVLQRVSLQLNLRDVRFVGDGSIRIIRYHVATYLARTDMAEAGFRPQPGELQDLRYFPRSEVDRLLSTGSLAPNMSFLWLTHAHRLLSLPGVAAVA